jgi:signal transduction histidine kinase
MPAEAASAGSRRGIFGLATKITLPFLALFALLLLVLGFVLAKQILPEVEARIENEQRVILRAITFGPPLTSTEALKNARNILGSADTQLIVLEDQKSPVSTLSRNVPADWQTVEALQAALEDKQSAINELHRGDLSALQTTDMQAALEKQPVLQGMDTIQSLRTTLNKTEWLLLYRSRPAGRTTRYQIFLLYPYAKIEQAKTAALKRIVLLGVIGLVLAAALGLLIGRLIARPIRRLAAAAGRIRSGGLGEHPDVDILQAPKQARDEIGELTLAFQSMLESLRASQKELLKAERLAATGKLAAGVAHEIRNPLTSLRMTVELLQQRAPQDDKNTQEAYKVVLGEIDRLALAVEELLTFARPRPAQREPMDLNKLVSDTLSFLQRQMAHARVKGEAELDPALPPDLLLDSNKLRQLLVNLILNAQQAIVRDGKVTVSTKWDGGQKRVTLSVADTGPGIAAEVRETIFDIFVSTKTGGAGLGLAIAKQIVEEHSGAISFETSPKGTTFKVVIPC